MPLSVTQLTGLTVLLQIGSPEFAPHLKDTAENLHYTARAQYQPEIDRWWVNGSFDNFLLLSSDVLDALIAEAFVKGYPVRYMDSRGNFVRV